MTKSTSARIFEQLDKRIEEIGKLLQKNGELIKMCLKMNEPLDNNNSNGEPLPKRLLSRFLSDNTLRYPHKKILGFLAEQYDYERGEYKEIYWSRIVKECGLGKNKAKEYLEFLVKKGLVKYRTDGYRKWYKVGLDVDG